MRPPSRVAAIVGPGAATAALILLITLAGCTRSTVLESNAARHATTTTAGLARVPNGGEQLPDAPTSNDTTATTAGTTTTAGPTTTAVPASPTAVAASVAPQLLSLANRITAATAGAAAQVVATTTTTAPAGPEASTTTTTVAPPPPVTPASVATTTTVLPQNPTQLAATIQPATQVPGRLQTFSYELPGRRSTQPATIIGCAGTDYQLDAGGAYVLAPFTIALDCSKAGEVIRTLPNNAPIGSYAFCVMVKLSTPTPVCTTYQIVSPSY